MTTQPAAPADDLPPLRPAPRLDGVRAYQPPAPRWAIDLRLDANEGPPPDPAVLAALRDAAPDLARRYPDARPLEADIARAWGLPPARVVVTNGGDDAIDRVCRAALAPGRAMLTHAPTFEMIPRGARLAGAEVVSVPWLDGPFPERAFAEAITPDIALVALVSPNNPTGREIPPDTIARLADRARRVGALVLADLAYAEFAGIDPTPGLLARDNVVIVRTFSKAFGLAGLRVGFAIAPEPVGAWLRAAGGPYPVPGPSLAAGAAAWARRDDRAFVERVRGERAVVHETCSRLGLEPLESGANFVTIRARRSAWIVEALGSLGIAVRGLNPPGFGPLCRITLPGDDLALARLNRALETAAAPEAMLFDLDGVLADVSGSYRAAIVATARSFGVSLGPEDIARAKARGDANNDWVLTRRLLGERGVHADLDEVVDRFQAVYLGAGGSTGLRERESLIPDPALLERLAARLPLAIVTGRPRGEAEWFLSRAGLRDLFGVVVAMEDAPPKPTPDPVRLAMERLGVGRAWLVGDTPDDAAAARAAGVVPVGISPPGDDPAPTIASLERAGVARVLNDLRELEGLLP